VHAGHGYLPRSEACRVVVAKPRAGVAQQREVYAGPIVDLAQQPGQAGWRAESI
jgi:hypothetical protein